MPGLSPGVLGIGSPVLMRTEQVLHRLGHLSPRPVHTISNEVIDGQLRSLCSTKAVSKQVTPFQGHSQQEMSVFVLEYRREVLLTVAGDCLPIPELVTLLSFTCCRSDC